MKVRVVDHNEAEVPAASIAGKPRAPGPAAERQRRTGSEAQPFAPGHL
jgi:hypothetical protein